MPIHLEWIDGRNATAFPLFDLIVRAGELNFPTIFFPAEFSLTNTNISAITQFNTSYHKNLSFFEERCFFLSAHNQLLCSEVDPEPPDIVLSNGSG